MRDKRPVDELSVEELERVLAIKRREERMQVMERMQRSGRVVEMVDMPPVEAAAAEAAMPAPAHDPVAAALASLTQPVMRESEAPVEAAPRFDEVAESTRSKANPKARRKIMDRFLLAIEVIAVLLIGVIGVNLFQAITRLDQETAQAQQLADEQRRLTIPTIAPTPTIRLENVVLPGGHIFTESGAVQFNYDEVPEFLRPRVQSEWVQTVVNRPPPTSETALALIIPKLNLNATIVPGVDWEALKQGVGQVLNGVNPGDDYGNISFAAHNDIYGKLFQHLDQLEPGDTFQIQTRTAVFTYSITDKLFVEPNQVEVLQPRQGATATLISCYPYQVNNQRIIIFADRIS